MGGHKYYLMKIINYHCRLIDNDCYHEGNRKMNCKDCDDYKSINKQSLRIDQSE